MSVVKQVFVGIPCVTMWFVYGNWMQRSHVKDNIKQLKWMDEHDFQSPKTVAECRLIARSIAEQEKWLSSWNIFKFAPVVKREDLPMDQDFIDEFH